MGAPTLTALSQRDEAFRIGLALPPGGSFPSDPVSTDPSVGNVLAALGGVILTARVLVAAVSILETTAVAGWFGYREGRRGE